MTNIYKYYLKKNEKEPERPRCITCNKNYANLIIGNGLECDECDQKYYAKMSKNPVGMYRKSKKKKKTDLRSL